MLHEQRNLIEILLKEKTQAKTGVPTTTLISTEQFTSQPRRTEPAISHQDKSQSFLVGPRPANQEVQDYNSLIKAMLREIDGCKSKLEQSRHLRIRSGVLDIYSGEIVHFQRNYGVSIFQCFADSVFEYTVPRWRLQPRSTLRSQALGIEPFPLVFS